MQKKAGRPTHIGQMPNLSANSTHAQMMPSCACAAGKHLRGLGQGRWGHESVPKVLTGNTNWPCLSETSLSRVHPGLCTNRLSTRNSEFCFHCSTVMRRAVRCLHRFSSWCRLQQQRTSFYPPQRMRTTYIPHIHPYACVQHTHWHVHVCADTCIHSIPHYMHACVHATCAHMNALYVCAHMMTYTPCYAWERKCSPSTRPHGLRRGTPSGGRSPIPSLPNVCTLPSAAAPHGDLTTLGQLEQRT